MDYESIHARSVLMIGQAKLSALRRATAAVFGLGGVGGQCAEALARAGIGRLLLVDGDAVALSNCNRQIVATTETVGLRKVDAMAQRLLFVNPMIELTKYDLFYSEETSDCVDLRGCDYIVDAVDTINAKLTILERARALCIPAVSCLGMGNKFDPTRVEIGDIYETSVCPLARVMRRELKKRGFTGQTCVFTREQPVRIEAIKENGRHLCGSLSCVPPAAGLACASVVIRDLLASTEYNTASEHCQREAI